MVIKNGCYEKRMNEIEIFVDEFYNAKEKESRMQTFFERFEDQSISLHDLHEKIITRKRK